MGARSNTLVTPTRRQRGKKSKGWMVAVFKDPDSFPEASCVVGVLQGWELPADDELRSPDHTTKSLAVLGCAAPIPHCDAPSQDALYCTPVEVGEDDWVHAKLLQCPQEEEAFPGRFDNLVRMSRPVEVIADVHPEESEAADL